MITNLGGKGVAALAQLYAIFVFSKIHTQNEASVIFLLLGYAIWFQVFEFGLAQTLQNRFNSGKSAANDVRVLIIFHYFFVLGLALYIFFSPTLPQLLLPADRFDSSGVEFRAFSIGMAMMIIATSNQIMQRMLLVLNKGLFANSLLAFQSIVVLLSLAFYQQTESPSLMISVLLYLVPPILVNFPLVLNTMRNFFAKRYKMRKDSYRSIFIYATEFWVLNILSAIFLGADYYFAAHHLDGEQVVSYHFATRFYFLSFIAYYAYVHHQARRLTPSALRNDAIEVRNIIRNSVVIGLTSVAFVYFTVITLDGFQVFERIINKDVIDHSFMFGAFCYFSIRVLRDVGVVVLGNVGVKSILYKVYIIEIALGLALLNLTVKQFSGMGIFLSMAFTCLISTAVLFYFANKLVQAPEYKLK